jgi:hypothetical protein
MKKKTQQDHQGGFKVLGLEWLNQNQEKDEG